MMEKPIPHFYRALWIVSFFLIQEYISAQTPCTANDDCTQAIALSGIYTDQPYQCFEGCNLYAAPEDSSLGCYNEFYPTVWYRITVDEYARVLNLQVTSSDFDSPVITAFSSQLGCDSLQLLPLTSSNLNCIIGTHGSAEAIGTTVVPTHTYYFAISSFASIGGDFQICINTNSQGSACVVDRNIEVKARSNGGPLEGPFDPGETIHLCINVNHYTAAGNGCQWFQGLVPVFGNGWDPASFDSLGQPMNASVNGFAMGSPANGLYSAATWNWFDSVDYHYDHPSLAIGDFDNNGRLDMCNSEYEMDCPQTGIEGGCCGPCWGDTLGAILPPGWFSYGINGTCPTPGPPIRVDWGDGNTCGDGMGAWQFCFDLKTREVPDCLGDSTKRDLSVAFYTFADGETGSWSGNASVCALDRPTKISLQSKCGRVVMHQGFELEPLCTGDTLRHKIFDPDVSEWEWNISPFAAVTYFPNRGPNGVEIAAPVYNQGNAPENVKGIFIGHGKNSNDKFIYPFKFIVNNPVECFPDAVEDPDAGSKASVLRVYPSPTDGHAVFEWAFDLKEEAILRVYNAQGSLVNSIRVSPQDGHQKQLDLGACSAGIYFISFSNEDFRHVTKVIRL